MTDKNLESASELQESADKPVRVPSGAAEGQPPSGSRLEQEDALVAKITAKLFPEIEKVRREFQSDKDRRIPKIEARVEEIARVLNVPVEQVEKAQREIAVNRLVEKEMSRASDGSGDEDTEDVAYMQAQTSIILQSAGVPEDDPDYNKLVDQYQGKIKDPKKWVDVVESFAKNRAKQERPAKPAAAFPESGRSAGKSFADEADELAAELEALYKKPIAETAKRRAEIKARMREIGPAKDIER